jgi:hypothetical protein
MARRTGWDRKTTKRLKRSGALKHQQTRYYADGSVTVIVARIKACFAGGHHSDDGPPLGSAYSRKKKHKHLNAF